MADESLESSILIAFQVTIRRGKGLALWDSQQPVVRLCK